jgi:hypothetical protein
MKQNILRVVLLFFMLTFLFSCEKEAREEKVQETRIPKQEQPDKSVSQKITEVEMKIPVRKIGKLTVKNFVQIYLSRMEHQLKWSLELQKYAQGQDISESEMASETGRRVIEQKEKLEKEFFRKWGITQQEFEKFAQGHEGEIQQYIANNEEVQQFIERIQKLNMQIYGVEGEYENRSMEE